MKPSWDDAPSWAQWLALDGDGEWYWYEVEPMLMPSGNWSPEEAMCQIAGFESLNPIKERRP